MSANYITRAGKMEGLCRAQQAAMKAATDALRRGQPEIALRFLTNVLRTVEGQITPIHQRPEVREMFAMIERARQ